MPAKQKYLSSGWERFSKVTAAILGGYIVTMFVHVAIAKSMTDDTPLVFTSAYSSFFVWVGTMILAFFIDKSWKVWALYLSITAISAIFIFIFPQL